MAISDNIQCDVPGETQNLVDTTNFLSHLNYALKPSGFNWPVGLFEPVVINKFGKLDIAVDQKSLIDLDTFTGTVYVDFNRPDDAGDGSSWANAKQSISAGIAVAVALGVATKVLIKAGVYDRSISFSNSQITLAAPIALIAQYGEVVAGIFDSLTYTQNATYSQVYEASRSNTAMISNPSLRDKHGNNPIYNRKTSLADCAAEEGSFYSDGSTIYVHDFGGVPVTNKNARAFIAARGCEFIGDHNVYLYGISFQGGRAGAFYYKGGATSTILANNCSFRYASHFTGGNVVPQDGFGIDGGLLVAAYDCDFSLNSKDGFNVHSDSGNVPAVISVRNQGFDNGILGVSNNGFTMHNGIKAIDVGSTWTGATGGNSAHIDSGTQVWCVGVTAGGSDGDTILGGTIEDGAFSAFSGAPEMWLDSCIDVGSKIGVSARDSAAIHLRNHSGSGQRLGNVDTY